MERKHDSAAGREQARHRTLFVLANHRGQADSEQALGGPHVFAVFGGFGEAGAGVRQVAPQTEALQAIEVSWNLGTRPGPSELLNIKWDDVDFERGSVRIFGRKTKDWREVAISEEFTRRLLDVREAALSEYLIEYQGRPMKKFRRSFQTACKRAGISYPVRMYDIRHLFASTMLTGGADLAAVSKLLEHSTIQMTANVYYNLQKGEKERAVNLLPSLYSEDEKLEKVITFRAADKMSSTNYAEFVTH